MPYRVQISRIGRVGLDLLPQAVDLHVDGPLVLVFAELGQILAADRLAAGERELAQHLALLIGKADRIVAAPQLVAAQIEGERPETHLSGLGRGEDRRLRMFCSRSRSSRGSNGFGI